MEVPVRSEKIIKAISSQLDMFEELEKPLTDRRVKTTATETKWSPRKKRGAPKVSKLDKVLIAAGVIKKPRPRSLKDSLTKAYHRMPGDPRQADKGKYKPHWTMRARLHGEFSTGGEFLRWLVCEVFLKNQYPKSHHMRDLGVILDPEKILRSISRYGELTYHTEITHLIRVSNRLEKEKVKLGLSPEEYPPIIIEPGAPWMTARYRKMAGFKKLADCYIPDEDREHWYS